AMRHVAQGRQHILTKSLPAQIVQGNGGVLDDVVENRNDLRFITVNRSHETQRMSNISDAFLVYLTRMGRHGDADGRLKHGHSTIPENEKTSRIIQGLKLRR